MFVASDYVTLAFDQRVQYLKGLWTQLYTRALLVELTAPPPQFEWAKAVVGVLRGHGKPLQSSTDFA